MIEELLKLFCCISSSENQDEKDIDIIYINNKGVKVIHNYLK